MIFLPKKLITAFAYAFFGAMKDLWIDFGKPAPKLIHFVRYRIFHRLPPKSSVYPQTGSPVTPMPRKEHPLPPDIPEVQSQKETEPQAKPNGDSIAVCIYCQDQHRTEETIRSVVSQSLQPAEIVILDESAQADSIALQLHENTIPIRLIRGTWNSPSSAFNAAVSLTNALYISCLQSGDVLHRGFLQCAYDVLTIDDRIGATYADVQEFAGGKSRTQYPDILNIGSTQTTLIPFSCLLLRRKALVDGNAWQNGSTEELLNIMLSNNWKLIKNPGMLFKQHVADTLSPASV